MQAEARVSKGSESSLMVGLLPHADGKRMFV